MQVPLRMSLAVGLVLAATAAQAASLPLASSYGSPNGCAVNAGGSASGSEETTLISPSNMRFGGNMCSYTGVTDAPGADGAKSWQVKIACESGHEEVVRGTLSVTERPEAKSLAVALVDGSGPDGAYEACGDNKAQ